MENKKTYRFKSETLQILELMSNYLYSRKDIVIRELISNASDALDKVRLESLYNKNSSFFKNLKIEELAITILFDKTNSLLTIRDNGIGMKYEEAKNNLGTIAKSGTKEFYNNIIQNNSKEKNNIEKFIGHFGVGFYSSFIIANKITVFSRSIFVEEKEGILWENEGNDKFNISYKNKNTIGTDVILQLKENENYILEESYLSDIIKKYSNFIKFPIYINVYNKKHNKFVDKKINEENIFWQKNKADITDIEYKEFYNKIFNNLNEPLAWVHHKVEGKVNYIFLLYIPQYTKNLSLYESIEKLRQPKIKLYIKNIFINDKLDNILPNYLKFIEGLVDAEDLPLNISRDILQNSNLIDNIKTILINKILKMLVNLSLNNKSIYDKFYEHLGFFLKEGIIEDKDNKNILISLLRFKSSKSGQNYITLDQYIQNMNSVQNKIYYISGINNNIIEKNPNLEIFLNNNIEVLYFSDRIDEWVINYINNYKNKQFQSLSTLNEKLIIEELKLTNKYISTEQNIKLKPFLLKLVNNFIKNNTFKIINIEFTNLLINAASSLVINNENNLTTNMSKLLNDTGHDTPPLTYILRLNVNHPILKYLINKHNTLDDSTLNEWITLLFEQALLNEQGYLDQYNDFITRINKLLTFNILQI